ncbi:MAG: indolepyruvate ferredoxin oxidoreductase subunit alpha [Desulfovibrionaceae bacterium]|nr:indolepyruvate ferredoxin oxidoreductase subunit alpha [Desulfovibrionaceae bacterium]MBF0513808.1 indolepyruvate ferredoxin oxidoreductase subunit alpha [Desulfovibrionaceae bacterium]
MAYPLLEAASGETMLLLGNEAIVRGALEGGVAVVACYPGTPSSEVPDAFFRMRASGAYYFEYSVNEKVALEVAGGAALGGLLSFATMKHVGVNVAADPLMTLCQITVPGGLALLSADDPGCHSSQNEQDNRYYARLAGMPCLEPATAQEAKDMTAYALTLSRETAHPVMLRTTTRVNHLRGPVVLGEVPAAKSRRPSQKNPRQFVPLPAHARQHHPALLERMEAIRETVESSPFNRISGQGPVGVLASGVSRAYLRDALLEDADLAAKLSVFELGFTYPLPQKALLDFVRGRDTVVVIEELEPILENDLRALIQKNGLKTVVVGKGESLPRHGEYSTQVVRDALRRALALAPVSVAHAPPDFDLAQRPPNMCAGCPHRASFLAVRQVYGDEAYYSSDIGCYTLGILPPFRAADFTLCMGSSVSAGSGFALAADKPVVAFIGDSTFFHSGITGLVNAVFNGHNLLVVILDNHTTGMTGHQPNPGVDATIHGENEARVDIMTLVRACGVTQVKKVNPVNNKAAAAAIAELAAASGVRVLIAEEPCPIHAKRVKKSAKAVAARVAGDPDACGEVLATVACPAFYLENGRFAINESQCTGCMLCAQICKEIKATSKEAGK